MFNYDIVNFMLGTNCAAIVLKLEKCSTIMGCINKWKSGYSLERIRNRKNLTVFKNLNLLNGTNI